MQLGVLLNGLRVPECPPHGTTSEQISFRQFLTNWLPCFGLCDHATLAINNQSGWDLAPDRKGAIYKLVLGTPETCEVAWHRSLSVQDQMPERNNWPNSILSGHLDGSHTQMAPVSRLRQGCTAPHGMAGSRNPQAQDIMSKKRQTRWAADKSEPGGSSQGKLSYKDDEDTGAGKR